MKTAFRLSIISVVLFSLFSFKYGGGDWVTFSEKKKAKFEVLFPEKPKADKKGDSWFISATLDEPLTNFYVSIDFGTASFTEQSFRDRVKSNVDVIETTFTTKVTDMKEIQFNGGLCMEYRYEMFGLKSLVRAFYKDNKLFELTCNPILGEVPEAEKDKFFNSFHYLP